MRLHFFSVPAQGGHAEQDALNRHLATHRVSHIERQFVADGAFSYWSLCVTTVEAANSPSSADANTTSRRGGKTIDWREVLAADEFALYDRLRRLRKGLAEAEGLPPYAVFSNEQLAAMVQGRVVTAAALAAIPGVGEARMKRYAESFVPLLAEGVPALVPTSAAS